MPNISASICFWYNIRELFECSYFEYFYVQPFFVEVYADSSPCYQNVDKVLTFGGLDAEQLCGFEDDSCMYIYSERAGVVVCV